MNYIYKILTLIIFITIFSCSIVSLAQASTKSIEFQNKLSQPYEKNADELMSLMKNGQPQEVEAFINYVEKKDNLTRNGIKYFRELLLYWFYSFDMVTPFPENLLPQLDMWVNQYPESDVALIIRGTFHIDYAWKVRGGGWAKEVTKGSWGIYYKHMALAQSDLLKACEINPHSVIALRQLMRVKTNKGRTEKEKEQLFNQIVAQSPTFYCAYTLRLNELMPKWGGSWKTMFKFAKKTANNAPEKTLLPLILIEAYAEAAYRSNSTKGYLNKPDVWNDIERIYKQAIIDFPHSGSLKTGFGTIAYDAGKFELAKYYWELAIKSDPYYYKAYEKLAIIYRGKKWELSEKYARKLIQLYPQYEEGYAQLVDSLVNQHKFKESIEGFNMLIQLSPDNYNNWINRGNTNYRIKEYKKAIEDCNMAIKINDKIHWAYKIRGDAYKSLGNNKDAELDYKKYKELHPKKNQKKSKQDIQGVFQTIIDWLQSYFK